MENPELIQVLDYILNRCDEASIDAVAEAVVRRRRQLVLFGGSLNIPDPQRMARELSGKINGSVSAGMAGLRKTIQDMTIRLIRQEAPELTDAQVEELTRAWIPGGRDEDSPAEGGGRLPRDLLASMIDQFVSFSLGTLGRAEEKKLRDDLGSWPERYWKAFPPVIRLIVNDYIKNEIDEKEFNRKIGIALETI
ncbi:MAG: hypothetical protein LBP27_01245 [Treponema sp.]|nr:hypothetical protein [Treponema sp.]